ncbi:hypothetical protein CHU98_g8571 [Xylaria longipes]|nr:hypothetical protein CHU98_g8571 [Xylaria longipes]
MMPLRLPFPIRAIILVLAASVQGKTTHQARVEAQGYPTTGIQWQPCLAGINAVAALDVECGTLAVPLDYTASHSTETLELSLLRVPAVKKPAKHSILFNFGGPGLGVRHSLAELADMLQAVTGGEHDLIGWYPRATAETLTFSCFTDTTDRAQLNSLATFGNASDVARGQLWAGGKIYADACAEFPEAQERAPPIGTSFTARDAMQIVDAVEEDGLLRYWGLSYGTDLGATLAALFPERVEKLILDGVFNPIQYFYERTDSEGFASADDTFSEFFRQCVSTPEVCTLAGNRPNATAKQLESAAYDRIEELKYHPFAYNGSTIGYAELKSGIRFALYTPYSWLSLDNILDTFLVESRNETLAGIAIEKFVSASLAGETSSDDASIGIECVDKAPRSNSFDVINAALDGAQSVSRLLGDSLAPLVATCAQWTLEPRERYIGGFARVKPRKPLLGSVLLEHGGFGHTSIQQPSLCTARAIQSFFRSGTLPGPNTLCDPVDPPFKFAASGPTWQDLFPQLGFEPPSVNGAKATHMKRRGHTKDALKYISRRLNSAF